MPKLAQPDNAPPLYLRLRMGKPLAARKGAMTTPIMSYGKKKMKPEYWFSIPRDKYAPQLVSLSFCFVTFLRLDPGRPGGDQGRALRLTSSSSFYF